MAFACGRCYLHMMRTCSGLHPRHPLVHCLALAAYLLAVGTPLLHVLVHAHGGDHAAHHAGHVASWAAESDDEVHPPQLHDRSVAAQSMAPLLVFTVSAPAWSLELPAAQSAVPFRLVSVLGSRAPPPGDPARAPPLA